MERPALHDFVTGTARDIIRAALAADARASTSWWSQIEEVRVRCEPTRLEPSQIELIVVARSGALKAAELDKWKQLTDQVRTAGKKQGIAVRLLLHETRLSMLAVTCRESTAVYLPELRHPPDLH